VSRAFLLDTNIVSELRKTRPHRGVLAWLSTVGADQLAIPAVVIGEIQAGVEITRLQHPSKAIEIETWLEAILASHSVVPMDAAIFREWARLMHKRQEHLAFDAMIAATARNLQMIVATRNVEDFEGLGVEIFNPFAYKG